MNRISKVYADASAIIRTKAPLVLVVLVIISVLLPILIVSDFLSGDYLNFAISLVILAGMIISIAALFRGKFRLASNLPLVVATLALIGIAVLIDAESRFQVYTVSVYMLAAVVLSVAMSESAIQTVIVSAVGLATVLLVSFLRIAPAVAGTPDAPFMVEATLTGSVVYTIIAVMAALVSHGISRALRRIEIQADEASQTLHTVAEVSRDARSSLDTSQDVAKDYAGVRSGVASIREQMRLVQGSIERLRTNLNNALASVRAIAERVVGFHAQVDEQNTVVQESTASVNEMSASLDSVAQITAARRESSQELYRVAQEGIHALEETNRSFDVARQEMNALLEINAIVGDIAAQTSLLSMNAAIEAAHAGDSGRGFAVVADEIRKLATSTSENSETISDNLKRLMDSITVTSEHANHTTAAMQRIADGVQQVSAAFEEITGSTAELSQGGREIMNAMQVLQNTSVEVRDGSDDISRKQQTATSEMEQISGSAEEMEQAVEQVSGAITSIDEAMSHLERTIEAANRQSTELTASISQLVEGMQ